jgi:UDP-N-acetylmuramoyl-L-alanyl-D-glutamate--2,6-diaminopimelate ligase
MDLGELTGDPALAGTQIVDLAYSSDDVGPGHLFFCVRGFTADGHDYAADAVRAGAAALVCERPLGLGVPEHVVSDARAAMPELAARFFGHPSEELRVVGITGTNGKTTAAYLVRQLLEAAGIGCGLIGTVDWVVGGQATPAVRTTPEAIDLQRAMRQMLDAGDRALAMEVSSHAMQLGRCEQLSWAVAVFTNLTQDHLDFHASLDEYFAAKRRLFEAGPRHAVSNVDDEYGRHIAQDFGTVTYSAAGTAADYRAAAIEYDARGTGFRLTAPDGEFTARLALPGGYNVANALAAVAAVAPLGVGTEQAVASLPGCKGAPGRFELVDAGQDFTVVVDYAHTPDSLDNVLRAATGLPHERLVTVFGAGGDRDRGKRPLMGEAAARISDVVWVTSDNPRSEDPAAIVAEVRAGCDRVASESGAEVIVEVDRRRAIEQALAGARAGDIVVIAGKGHEQGQEFEGGRKVPFDDASVAREALERLTAAG